MAGRGIFGSFTSGFGEKKVSEPCYSAPRWKPRDLLMVYEWEPGTVNIEKGLVEASKKG